MQQRNVKLSTKMRFPSHCGPHMFVRSSLPLFSSFPLALLSFSLSFSSLLSRSLVKLALPVAILAQAAFARLLCFFFRALVVVFWGLLPYVDLFLTTTRESCSTSAVGFFPGSANCATEGVSGRGVAYVGRRLPVYKSLWGLAGSGRLYEPMWVCTGG